MPTYRKIMNLKWTFIIITMLVLLITIVKTINLEINTNIGIIGSLYTFYYGFFINSIFKFLESKYIQSKIAIGRVIGYSQSLFNISILTKQKKLIKNIKKELIDFLKTFNKLKPEYYEKNQFHIPKLYKALSYIKESTGKKGYNKERYSRMLQCVNYLSELREKLEVLGDNYIVGQTKSLFISLSVLFSILIVFISFFTGGYLIMILGILILTMVIFITKLMLDIDDLSYGEYKMKKQNIKQIVKSIENQKT